MKQLIFLGCFAALFYLQSCGGKKNDADSQTAAHSNVPIPDATDNVAIHNEKDLAGYWVGYFAADNGNVADSTEYDGGFEGEYIDKINLSIDTVNDGKVKGHSVLAGNVRSFSGTYEKVGDRFLFTCKEPGTLRTDGVFKFSIAMGDTLMKGTWLANKALKVPKRKYALTKKFFHYDPTLKLELRQFVDYSKSKEITEKVDDSTTYKNTGYFSTTADVDKYNASMDIITKAQAANLKKADLIVLRNSIFARHGYAFKKKALRGYFEQLSWYIPLSNNVQNEITPREKKNIAILQRFEKNAAATYEAFGR